MIGSRQSAPSTAPRSYYQRRLFEVWATDKCPTATANLPVLLEQQTRSNLAGLAPVIGINPDFPHCAASRCSCGSTGISVTLRTVAQTRHAEQEIHMRKYLFATTALLMFATPAAAKDDSWYAGFDLG